MAIKVTGNIVISDTQAISNVTTISANGNANLGNLGTASVLATANVTAPQLISNISTGTAPLTVSSTTVVANLNADLLDGYNTATAATANTIAVRDTNGNLTANFFSGNGSQLTGVTAGFPIANGTSNINAPAVNGNVNISVGGTANVLITTSTGVNVAGTLNASGNANTGNLGTGRILASGNITTTQLISNIATGTAPLVVSSTTAVANLNADLLDGYNTATAATANTVAVRDTNGNITANFFSGNGSQLTGISAGFPIANGTSNINAPAVNGNVNISVGGVANVLVTTTSGVNVAGTLNATGNANTGNLGTTTAIITTGNITTINSGLVQNGNSNIAITANGNIGFSVTGSANEVVFTSTGANVNGYLTVTGNITGGILSNSTNVFSTASSNYTIGYRQMPQNSQSGATYTLVLDDEGKSVVFTGTTTCTLTVPTNSSQAFPVGSVMTFINNNSGNLTINSSATLQLANGNAANRTVLTKGMATCIKIATDTWYIIGAGVS